MLTQEYLMERFDYHPDGFLIWKDIKKNPAKVRGKRAGCLKEDKYIDIAIDNVHYLSHRLIFLYHKGYLPDRVDHKDNNKYNNRIENLREASAVQNKANSTVRKDSTSGLKNIRVRSPNSFQVEIRRGREAFRKTFHTVEEAIEYRDNLLKELDGEFSRTI